ncbi:MAG: type II toxin-antitoxin system VapC family toxin [Phenylobacterium sp.]
MRVLLDTHLVLWTLLDPQLIVGEAANILKDAGTSPVISVASLWEIAIKRATGKLSMPDDFPERVHKLGREVLPIMQDHAWRAGALPPHHGDPFDRLLVAQAQVEDIPLVTHDRHLERYDVRIIWA